MYLLDVNVLIALSDTFHSHHTRARNWWRTTHPAPWATCPITENGFLRILGQATYPNFSGGPNGALSLLDDLVRAYNHQFWPDDFTLRNSAFVSHLPPSKHLTDIYLLSLAASRNGWFATFDQNIDPDLVTGGRSAYFQIP